VVEVHLDLSDPASHRVGVSLRLKPRLARMRLQFPGWTPGSYLIRDYVRQLEGLEVRQGAHRLEAHALKAVTGVVERKAVLEAQAEGAAEALDQARARRAFLGNLDEDLTRTAILEQADREVTLMAVDGELVGEGAARLRQDFAASGGAGGHGFHPWKLTGGEE
jgi:hypothetical protein